jgi:polar amino acid transport system permease protein
MDFAWVSTYWPLIVAGAMQTVLLLAISVSFGFILAIGLALAQVSGTPWLRWLARGYCTLFRGTPLLIQLWLFYYGVGSFLPMGSGSAREVSYGQWCARASFSPR